MEKVGIREFKRDASKILRRVREDGESFDVTYHGRVVARLTPVEELEEEPRTLDEIFDTWDALAEEIGENWPKGLSAVDAIREDRGRLE